MNILVVCQHYWPEPFNVNETCEILAEAGHTVTVITGLPNYPDGVVYKGYENGRHRRETKNGIVIKRAWLIPRGRNLKGFGKLKRIANYLSFAYSASSKELVNDCEYDVVLCVQYSPILMAYPAIRHASRREKPCIIYSYDLWPEDLLTGGLSRDGLAYKIMKRISRRIYAKADILAITSPGFEDYFKNELGLIETRYFYLPQYAEDQFVELGRECKSFTEEKSTIDIVFAGNIGGNQGIENVVLAANLLSDHPEIRFHIVGSGSKLETCKQLTGELALRNVIFYGRQPLSAMPSYYSKADAMLLALSSPANGSLVSRYTVPRKLQSYLAAGKPIIVFGGGSVQDLAEQFKFGICSDSANPESLAESIKRFSEMSHEQRMKMAENARKTYEQEFTKTVFKARFDCLLGELA